MPHRHTYIHTKTTTTTTTAEFGAIAELEFSVELYVDVLSCIKIADLSNFASLMRVKCNAMLAANS